MGCIFLQTKLHVACLLPCNSLVPVVSAGYSIGQANLSPWVKRVSPCPQHDMGSFSAFFPFFFFFSSFWDLYPVCPRLKYRCNNLSQSALTTTLWRTRHHDRYSSPGRLAFSFNRRELFWATCSVRWNRMSQSIWTKLHGGARVNGTMWLTVLRSRNSRD